MFTYRIPLLSLFGFRVYLDASWLLLAVLIVWSLAVGVFPFVAPGHPAAVYVWMGIGAAVGLLVSVALHETAHALVARRFEMPIRGITLFVFGGVAEMESEPASPRGEFLMALAGPVMSAVLGLLFVMAAGALAAAGAPRPATVVAAYLGTLNWALAAFNLIPGFPLDGGRMLRAALWAWRRDYAWATRFAAGSGQAFGILLIVFGVFLFLRGAVINGAWLFLIGLFLRSAAGAAYHQIMARRLLAGEPVARFMTRDPIAVGPDATVQSLVDDYIYRFHHKTFPVADHGRLVGCIGTNEIAGMDRSLWRERKVSELMRPCSEAQVAPPGADALQAMSLMNRSGVSRLLVVDQGRLVGVLALSDLMALLARKLELERPGPGRRSGRGVMRPAAHA